jgi:hypothetical protein
MTGGFLSLFSMNFPSCIQIENEPDFNIGALMPNSEEESDSDDNEGGQDEEESIEEADVQASEPELYQ